MGRKNKIQIIGGQDIIPHDKDTERAVLGTLIRYNEQWEKFSDILNVDMFYEGTERKAYQCIEGVIKEGNIANTNSLCEYAERHEIQLTEGTIEEYQPTENRHQFAQLAVCSSIYTIEQDVARLRYLSKQRLSWLLLQQVSKNVVDPTLDIDEELNMCISALTALQDDTTDSGVLSMDDAVERLTKVVTENAEGKLSCLHSGFALFDDHYLLRDTTVTVIAAFTSVGKSSLAMNIAVNVAEAQTPVAYYSLEMNSTELLSRIISHKMGLSSSFILNARMNEWQLQKYHETISYAKSLPIYIDERSTVSFDRTVRSIRAMVKTKGVRLVVIDYLQIFSQNREENQEQFLGYMARTAKNLAKELNIAIILISQLNRGGLHPAINMMRGSGQIEESADHIVLIDRPEAYPENKVKKYEGKFENETTENTAKLILSKGRGVGSGCSLVGYQAQYTRFFDMSEQAEAPSVEQESKTETEDTGNYPFRAQEEDLPF